MLYRLGFHNLQNKYIVIDIAVYVQRVSYLVRDKNSALRSALVLGGDTART